MQANAVPLADYKQVLGENARLKAEQQANCPACNTYRTVAEELRTSLAQEKKRADTRQWAHGVIDSLEEQIEELTAALRHYASRADGEVARKALKE